MDRKDWKMDPKNKCYWIAHQAHYGQHYDHPIDHSHVQGEGPSYGYGHHHHHHQNASQSGAYGNQYGSLVWFPSCISPKFSLSFSNAIHITETWCNKCLVARRTLTCSIVLLQDGPALLCKWVCILFSAENINLQNVNKLIFGGPKARGLLFVAELQIYGPCST